MCVNLQQIRSERDIRLGWLAPARQFRGAHFINPRRACAARVTVLAVCVSVCLSVTTFSATARNNAPNKIYQRLQRDMSKVLKMAFSLKMLGSASFAYRGSVRRCCSDP